jgi:hypothetical protein
MKILFVGPSLHGLVADGRLPGHPDIVCRAPAAQGDVATAVLDGATVIGLVDGRYEDVAAPWHKEILWALANGVTVLGAGSLGALRAAECAAYGMIGLGEVYERYRRSEIYDDSDVAQIHGPAEMDHLPLGEALVNVEATLRRLRAEGLIDDGFLAGATRAARSIFFKDLSFEAVAARLAIDEARRREFVAVARAHRVDQKRADALLLVEHMAALPAVRAMPPPWRMNEPHQWLAFLQGLVAERSRAAAPADLPAPA